MFEYTLYLMLEYHYMDGLELIGHVHDDYIFIYPLEWGNKPV